jgi:CheY-like chemotaxis protein
MGEAPKRCLEVGANDYLPKPYNVANLKTKMENWFVNKNTDYPADKNITKMENNTKDSKKESYIDLTYLEQLSEGDDDFTISMLSYFIDNTPGVITDMKEHHKQSEWKSLRNVAHKFKPQLTFMGIKTIFDDVENIETYAKKVENTDRIPELINRVEHICNKAMEEIKNELEKLLDKDQ